GGAGGVRGGGGGGGGGVGGGRAQKRGPDPYRGGVRPLGGRTPRTSLVQDREAPHGHVRRQASAVVGLGPDQLAQLLQGLAADGDVVVIAAGVADRVPDAVQLVGLGQGRPQLLLVDRVQRQARGQVV